VASDSWPASSWGGDSESCPPGSAGELAWRGAREPGLDLGDRLAACLAEGAVIREALGHLFERQNGGGRAHTAQRFCRRHSEGRCIATEGADQRRFGGHASGHSQGQGRGGGQLALLAGHHLRQRVHGRGGSVATECLQAGLSRLQAPPPQGLNEDGSRALERQRSAQNRDGLRAAGIVLCALRDSDEDVAAFGAQFLSRLQPDARTRIRAGGAEDLDPLRIPGGLAAQEEQVPEADPRLGVPKGVVGQAPVEVHRLTETPAEVEEEGQEARKQRLGHGRAEHSAGEHQLALDIDAEELFPGLRVQQRAGEPCRSLDEKRSVESLISELDLARSRLARRLAADLHVLKARRPLKPDGDPNSVFAERDPHPCQSCLRRVR
jgi:hypothetical protein